MVFTLNNAFCYGNNSAEIKAVIAPHIIPVTVIGCFFAAWILSGSIYLVFRRNQLLFRRKAALYLVLSSVGLLLYIRDTLAIAWTYPIYCCDLASFLLYYLGAAPFNFLPMVIRSWRTFCIYRPTPNFGTCQTEDMLGMRIRRHRWMIQRMVINYIPFMLPLAALAYSLDLAYYLWVGVESVYAIINFALAWQLYLMRGELKGKYLDENLSLFAYSTIAALEVVFGNLLYMLAATQTNLLLVYMYGDLVIVFTMWLLTGAKAIFIMRKKTKEIDNKAMLTISSANMTMTATA